MTDQPDDSSKRLLDLIDKIVPAGGSDFDDALRMSLGKTFALLRCDTCKWWDTGDRVPQSRSESRGCRRLSDPWPDGVEPPKLRVEDDWGGVDTYTEPDFGCVQWEAR